MNDQDTPAFNPPDVFLKFHCPNFRCNLLCYGWWVVSPFYPIIRYTCNGLLELYSSFGQIMIFFLCSISNKDFDEGSVRFIDHLSFDKWRFWSIENCIIAGCHMQWQVIEGAVFLLMILLWKSFCVFIQTLHPACYIFPVLCLFATSAQKGITNKDWRLRGWLEKVYTSFFVVCVHLLWHAPLSDNRI